MQSKKYPKLTDLMSQGSVELFLPLFEVATPERLFHPVAEEVVEDCSKRAVFGWLSTANFGYLELRLWIQQRSKFMVKLKTPGRVSEFRLVKAGDSVFHLFLRTEQGWYFLYVPTARSFFRQTRGKGIAIQQTLSCISSVPAALAPRMFPNPVRSPGSKGTALDMKLKQAERRLKRLYQILKHHGIKWDAVYDFDKKSEDKEEKEVQDAS